MSREVRRVPMDYKHPTEPDRYWREKQTPFGRSLPPSRLHNDGERFTPLFEDYPRAVVDWAQELAEIKRRSGHTWHFGVEYYLTGIDIPAGTESKTYGYHVGDGYKIKVRDEAHLQELLTAEKIFERPDPDQYMPVFVEDEADLGWCLYESVSEGTPVTAVCETADDLIDYLEFYGQDYEQIPMRRAAAKAIVNRGSTLGSMAVVGGVFYDATMDADALAEALKKETS